MPDFTEVELEQARQRLRDERCWQRLLAKAEARQPPLPERKARAWPGSEQKLRVLRRRFRLRQQLWHPDEVKLQDGAGLDSLAVLFGGERNAKAASLRVILGKRREEEAAMDIEDLKDRLHRRLMAKREVDRATGCEIWTGAWQARTGLGLTRLGNTQYIVSRIACWVYLGGFDLDDPNVVIKRRPCCTMPACFALAHLQLIRRQPTPQLLFDLCEG